MTNVHPHGYFLDDSPDGLYFDQPLCDALVEMLRPSPSVRLSVTDLGCGKGDYVRQFIAAGIRAYGFEANPEMIGDVVDHCDLSQPRHCECPTDVAISLEVGEHIPAQFEDTFLDNVTISAGSLIVLSWAVPGQGGRGHVSERPNSWVVDQMTKRGWALNLVETTALRRVATLPWFKNTLMVFRRLAVDVRHS